MIAGHLKPAAFRLGGQKQVLSSDEWKRFCEIMNGYIYSQALATACEFDLFTHLSKHDGATLGELQEKLSLSEYATRVLLLACCACGLIHREENTGKYTNSSIAEKVLVSQSPYSMVSFVRFNHQVQQRCANNLTQSLRECRNAGLDELPGEGDMLYHRLTKYPELESLFQEAMNAYTRLSTKMLDVPELAEIRNLLDIGGGEGGNAIRFCRQYPNLKVTILDLPTVCRIARKTIERNGLSDRISCVARDMFEETWPENVNGILLSHVVEIFSPQKIRFLYKKAYEALPAGGRLFIWAIMANDSETGGLQAAKSSIYFLSTASGEGMAYPGKDHEQWLREAGFKKIARYDAIEYEHGAIVAEK